MIFQNRKYNNTIAIAKGIAIILMVGGHASYHCFANDLLSIVHMPLFFVMSGYLFKSSYIDNTSNYISKKITGLYMPLVKYSLLFLFLHNSFYYIGIYNDSFIDILDVSRLYTFQDILLRAIRIITTMHGYDRLLGGYWFIHSLFYASLLFYFLQKIFGNKYILQFILFIMLSVIIKYWGLYIPYFHIDYLPFMAASMMMFGRLYHEHNLQIHKSLVFVIFAIFLVSLLAFFMPTAMPQCKYYQIIPYTLVSIMGSMVILGISEVIEKSCKCFTKVLTYVGKRTFAILTWHMISFKLVTLLIIYLYHEPYSRLAETLVLSDYVTEKWGG